MTAVEWAQCVLQEGSDDITYGLAECGRAQHTARLHSPNARLSGRDERAGDGAMKDRDEECVITDEDLRAALKEIGVYIDVTLDDLKRIYALALRNAKERKGRMLK